MTDGMIAALAAAVVALVGYAINNVISYKNTGRQLEHDREQKHAERRLALRREIYLGVAANLQDSLFAIADYAWLHVDAAATQANWRKNAHFAAKLHLMAGGDLLRAYNAANIHVGSAMGPVIARRTELDEVKLRMSRLLDSIKNHDNAKERAWEALRERGREGTLDAATRARLETIIDGEHKAREQLAQEHDGLLTQLRASQRELMRFAQQKQLELYPLFVTVAKAARAELGEAFDAEAYEEVLRLTAVHATEAIERAFGPAPSAAPTNKR